MESLHQRLVNTTLTVAGWLTLTGLQSRRPPGWLWLLRLLPLVAYVLLLLGAVLLLASSPTEQQAVEGLSVYAFFLQTAVILFVFVMRRQELDGLDRQMDELSQRAACLSRTTRRRILARIALFVLLAAINCGIWISFPMVNGNFAHGNYNIQMKFPSFLETPESYWFCMAFQITVVVLSCSLALTFDCCFFTWMNAVMFHLTTVKLAIERIGSQPLVKEAFVSHEKNDLGLTSLEFSDEEEKTIFSIQPLQRKESKPLSERNQEIDTDKQAIVGRAVFLGKVQKEKEETASGFTDPATVLRTADQHYSQIKRLVDSINQLCGLPVLLTHASTMSNLLFGLFATIYMAAAGRGVRVFGYLTYICIFSLRITFYSYDGGSILEKNSELIGALADMDWLGLSEAAKMRRESLMQKASQPLCIHALGVFVINKINVLHIFSFLVTYLIILIQMLNSVNIITTNG